MSPPAHTSAEAALTGLLQSLFDVNGLRRFLRGSEDTHEVADYIPGENAPLINVAFQTTEELLRRGLAGSAFFDRLAHAFPHRRADVEAVMQRLGVEALPLRPEAAPLITMGTPQLTLGPSPSMRPDRQVVDTFAELYPSPQQARAVWERAGGRGGDVPYNSERPRTMWWELWRQSLLGGPASPQALLEEALQDAPNNAVVREALARWAEINRG